MPELCSVFVCVFPGYLAVTVSTRLVTVGVKAFICVTVTWSTGRRPPPTPGTLVVNSTHIHTDSRISNEWVESAERESNRAWQKLLFAHQRNHVSLWFLTNNKVTDELGTDPKRRRVGVLDISDFNTILGLSLVLQRFFITSLDRISFPNKASLPAVYFLAA